MEVGSFSAVTRRRERRSDLTPCASSPYAALASEHHGGLMHNRPPCDGRGGEHHQQVRRPAPVAASSSIGPLAVFFLWPRDAARHCSTWLKLHNHLPMWDFNASLRSSL